LLPITADGSVNKVFVGAKDHFAFGDINKQVNDGLGRTVDLENLINYGWYYFVRVVLRQIATPILWCVSKLNALTGSYGISIILFTILLYSLLFPLKMRSSKAMKKAQKHQPRMKEIQDQMKKLKADDPKMRELQMEQLRLMKEANFIGGCLPMLLQIPFFIALYTAITISADFRQAAFLWFPDLSAGDPFHLLEFAMAGSMVLSMVFAPQTPAVTPEQQMQQKMMSYMMPVMMLWVLWGAPAGLLLYWFVGNMVTFLQQMILNRMNKSDDSPAEDEKKFAAAKKVNPKLSAS
jgi:YidC/Oxa1 family membrane protein insertase